MKFILRDVTGESSPAQLLPNIQSPSHVLLEGGPSARQQRFQPVSSPNQVLLNELSTMSIDFPKEEEAIIARWREIKAFERQVCTPLPPLEHPMRVRHGVC